MSATLSPTAMSRTTPRDHAAVALPELAPDALEFWHAQHRTNPRYDSAFFHPGFAQAVQASGRDVSVVVRRGSTGAVTAVLPFHRERTLMRPLGWPGADFQGPILAPGTSIDPVDLLPRGIKAFEFDHLLEIGDGFEPWISARNDSPYVETAGGLDGYLGRASKSGRQNMSQARRRVAKAEREIGPVRFEADVVDDVLLRRVIDLKRAQYRATGARDYFADGRRIKMLQQLLHTRDTAFAGVLSAVYAGDRLLAAHFGIRAGGVLHWWFPVYDPEFAGLAPGWILLRELVLAAPEMAVDRIDLGRGDDDYKKRAKTGETVVCAGYVSSSAARVAVRRAKARSIQAAKNSPIGPMLRGTVRGWRSRGGE